jgi:hypothetical protein
LPENERKVEVLKALNIEEKDKLLRLAIENDNWEVYGLFEGEFVEFDRVFRKNPKVLNY